MWPLWLGLLLGWPAGSRCLVVDQVEEGRALVTDGERVAVVPVHARVHEGDRLCPPIPARPKTP